MLGLGISLWQIAVRQIVYTVGGGGGPAYAPTYHILGF